MIDFATDFWRTMRKVFVIVTPPIVIALIRWIRNRFLRYHLLPTTIRKPSGYSTLDNPIEVPSQVECYLFCRDKYLKPTDTVLDVGFGLGYGLQIMGAKAEKLYGVEVDIHAINRSRRIFAGHPRVVSILLYDGIRLPFRDKIVDVVTCIEVLEHVEEYKNLLLEMARVARRVIFISTPNRRSENTLLDGRPKNYWHLREWTRAELDANFADLDLNYEWNFLNGSFKGPFTWTEYPTENTWSLVPVILLE